MKTIGTILAAVMAVSLLASCSDEVFGGQDAWGNKVTITLNYKQSLPDEVIVSRSGTTDATTPENALNNLQVFIFDEKGRLKGYKYVDSGLQQDGNVGTVEVKTTAGKCYIYGVANVSTALYKIEGSAIPTSAAEATTDNWDEEKVRAGENSLTLSELKSILFKRVDGEFNITDGQFMMSGVANDGKECTINSDGSIAEEESLIKLRRIVAKVLFKIKASEGRKFDAKRYKIHNVPLKGYLVKADDESNPNVTSDDFNICENTFDKQDEDNGYQTFTLYLPENLQNQNLTEKRKSKFTDWTKREEDSGVAGPTKSFTNAPEYGTYVKLTGYYTEGTTEANAIYFIHLGDFDNNLADFDVKRNYFYTYTVTVNGVNSISVDADTKYDGSTEGIVFNLEKGTIFNLDSHYGQVDMTFSRTNDIQSITLATGTEVTGFYVKVNDINNTDNIGVAVVTADGVKNLEGKDITTQFNTMTQWLKFGAGTGLAYSDLFTQSEKGNTHSPSKAKTLLQALQEMISQKDNVSWWSDGYKGYTCFVDENYYSDKKWSEYVNKDPRYVYIARMISSSADSKSFRANVIYGVSQYSIQTFYNRDKASSIIAYGCETLRDDNFQMKSSNDESTKVQLNNFSRSGQTNSWNGLSNMKQDMNGITTWNGYLNTYTQYAKFACLSRNRDLDGDGTIDDDEVRWYCPAINQYIGMWIGRDAFTEADAQLFLKNTLDLKSTYNSSTGKYEPNESADGGIEHYFTNTSGASEFWAEQGGSISDSWADERALPSCAFVRCVRNLQSNGAATANGIEPDMYYTKTSDGDNAVIDLSNMDKSSVRTLWQDSDLPTHHERSVSNEPAQKFIIATSRTTQTTTMSDITDTESGTICSQYSEDGKKWRAPNQKEFLLMYAINVLQTGDLCRTHFSNTNYKWTWYKYNGGLGLAHPQAPPSDISNLYVRCVRDHDDMNK